MKISDEYSITIGKLINVVHTYTDPVRIKVVMGDAWSKFDEAKRMRDFVLIDRYIKSYDNETTERIEKYYKDVPVWNLTVWFDEEYQSGNGRAISCGIKANCFYEDIRNGWIAEQEDIKRAKRKEYREKRKASLKGGEQA